MIWLVRFSSDLTTKLHNTRRRFQGRLARNLKDALDTNSVKYQLQPGWSRLFLESEDPRVPELLQKVFAVHSFSEVKAYPVTTLEDLASQGKTLYEQAVYGKTYAVRARRTGEVPFSSMDIQVKLGAALNGNATVNLSHPQVTVYVEVRDGQVYFFSDQQPGPGGLPLGVEGKAMALMSGGFDSAVAAWMMLKRGVALDYVFFRLGGEPHERDVQQVLQVLSQNWSYGTRPRLYVVPFEEVITQIQDKVQTRYWQLILKRQMYRVAQAVARRCRIYTLITGEALGQVSSQTLTNLEALNVTGTMPVLRPLIGFNKQDIIQKAYQIGTGAISARVPEYCAIVAQRPATAAKFEHLDFEEAKLNVDIGTMIRTAKRVNLRQETLVAPQYETANELPDGQDVVLLDIRTESEFRRVHDPQAMHFEFAYALDLFPQLDKAKTYYVYCNVGLKSANLVERMKLGGYKATVYQPASEEFSDVA